MSRTCLTPEPPERGDKAGEKLQEQQDDDQPTIEPITIEELLRRDEDR